MDTSSLADALGWAAAAAGFCSSMYMTNDPCEITMGECAFSEGSGSLSLVVALLLLLLLLLVPYEAGRLMVLRGLTFIFLALDRAALRAPKDAGVSGTSRIGFGLVAGVLKGMGEVPLESMLPVLALEVRF
jgi:hypothetical protein